MASKIPHDKIEPTRAKEARLASLYEEYYDRIAHYVYVRIGDKSEAEDIASEVFLKALESLRTYEERGLPMQAWLFKIARNMVVDHLRKATKYKKIPIETVEINDESDPQKTAETNIEMEKVAIAMQQLTDAQKEVIQLRFFGGLNSREVSVLLNKSDGAVREMQRAALEKLRGLLSESKLGD